MMLALMRIIGRLATVFSEIKSEILVLWWFARVFLCVLFAYSVLCSMVREQSPTGTFDGVLGKRRLSDRSAMDPFVVSCLVALCLSNKM